MIGIVVAFAAITVITTIADAKKRPHVVIHKQPVCNYPGCDGSGTQRVVPLVAIPPLAVMFDIVRRTSCDPRIAVSTGPGDPGFDPTGPKTGNFIIPAIYRRECGGVQPK
jgi:hypothetical protein